MIPIFPLNSVCGGSNKLYFFHAYIKYYLVISVEKTEVTESKVGHQNLLPCNDDVGFSHVP